MWGSSWCQLWLISALVLLNAFLISGAGPKPWTSRPGGAGYAMLFDDTVISIQGLKGMPDKGLNEFTFEAWLSTTDVCHESTVLSYARDVPTTDPQVQNAASNHFIIYNTKDLIACHDFPILKSTADNSTTCDATFKMQRPRSPYEQIDSDKDDAPNPISIVSRDGGWHHLAVTWTAANNGTTSIYVDGALRASAETGKLQPFMPDGILMLGQDQDCFGGCTDSQQAFYGLMDEVRLWKKARTHDQIAHSMRYAYGLESDEDLLAYWKFDDPDEDAGMWQSHSVAKDAGPHANDLVLINPPEVFSPKNATKPITQGGKTLDANQLAFRRNYLLGVASNVPAGSFTLEFWARGASLPPAAASPHQQLQAELSETFFSYATTDMPGFGLDDPKPSSEFLTFMDDAIKVQRVLMPHGLTGKPTGLIRVAVNSNSQAGANPSGRQKDAPLYKEQSVEFDAGWTDDGWHHVAVTWEQASGFVEVYLDGEEKKEVGLKQTAIGKQQSIRIGKGSLTIGMDQNCFMGCLDENTAANGAVAAVRLWGVVRAQADIQKTMWEAEIMDPGFLLAWQLLFREADASNHFRYNFTFTADRLFPMRFDSPRPAFVYSTAPLTLQSGAPVPPPQAGAAGSALMLSDQQLVMVPSFKNFPSTAITVEFWIKTFDKCRKGSPFSYATGDYGNGDNTFLITNHMDWVISVMEDQGQAHESSGVSSANGQWQHIAVTWDLATGRTILYQNANPMWWITRNSKKPLPSNGTLVIGREQDCRGGCFDSARGAVGRTSAPKDEEYGAQDFFGSVEEMRVWKVALDALEIRRNIQLDVGAAGTRGVDAKDPDLVAYWKFDEGTGYTVKDETGNGNDLLIMSEARWEVVKWLSFCGDGIRSGEEECDDGNDDAFDGCTADCHVAPGYVCDDNGFPSICHKIDALSTPPPAPSPTHRPHTLPPFHPDDEYPRPSSTPTPSTNPSVWPIPRPAASDAGASSSTSGTSSRSGHRGQSTSSKKEGMSGGMIFLTVLLCCLGAVAAGIAWVQRDVLLGSVAHLLPSNRRQDGWSPMATDLEELNLGFAPSMPATAPDYAPVPSGPQEP